MYNVHVNWRECRQAKLDNGQKIWKVNSGFTCRSWSFQTTSGWKTSSDTNALRSASVTLWDIGKKIRVQINMEPETRMPCTYNMFKQLSTKNSNYISSFNNKKTYPLFISAMIFSKKRVILQKAFLIKLSHFLIFGSKSWKTIS